MIAEELTALLEPLETFEAIRRRAVRLGDRLCDLSYANPYEGPPPSVRRVLHDALDGDRQLDLQYTPFGGMGTVRRAVADDLTGRYSLPFAHDDVVLTPGAMAALHLAVESVGQPGDEVIIPTPCWLDYPVYVRYLRRTPVFVPLRPPRMDLDVAAIEDAITPRTCAVLLSHPSNPAGRCYAPAVLSALGEVLRNAERSSGRPITVIADEAHRDFTDRASYRSLASAWPETVIVYSFGKYHSLQGQRTGYLAVSPRHSNREPIAADALRWSRVKGFCTPTALMQRAVPALLRLEHDVTQLAGCRADAVAELTAAGYQVVSPDATFFLYVATPHAHDDFGFIRRLAAAGVLALPAPVFHHRGYFRLSLMTGGTAVERGIATLKRLRAAA